MRLWLASVVVLPLGLVAACSSSDPAPVSPTPDAAPVDDGGVADADAATGDEIAWQKCGGAAGRTNECAVVKLPLDWSAPKGKTIDVKVIRSRAKADAAAPVAIWQLPGGPGQKGEVGAMGFNTLFKAYDHYTLDPRGTGASTPLNCEEEAKTLGWFEPQDVPQVKACADKLKAQWGDDLRHFSTSNAARDIAELLRRTTVKDQARYVLGVSYGTGLALRLLQVAPELPLDGVILDSTVSPTRSWVTTGMNGGDAPLRTLVESCNANNDVCKAKIPDPPKFLSDLLAKINTGTHCPTTRNYTAKKYRRVIQAALATPGVQPMLPAFLYRVNRCDPADEPAIEKFAEGRGAFGDDASGGPFTVGLHLNVVFSEYVSKSDPGPEAIAAAENATLVTAGEAAGYRLGFDVWPTFPADPLVRQLPTTNVPLLMLAGAWDPLTPPAEQAEVKSHFTAPNQTLVPLLNSGHSSFLNYPCPTSIVSAFVKAPTSTLDVSCASKVTSLFAGNAQLAKQFFGTADVFENP